MLRGQQNGPGLNSKDFQRFSYKARDLNDQASRGVVVATDAASAQEQLFLKGCRLIELKLLAPSGRGAFFKKTVKKELQFSFIQRLAALLNSGFPLLQALDLLQSQTPSRALREKISELKAHVREGHPLSAALLQVQPFLDALSIHMLRAAEARGSLPETLFAIEGLWRKRRATVRQLQSTLTYPCILLFMGVCVMGFLSLWVLPRFKAVFASSLGSTQLPGLTRFVLQLPEYGWLFIAGFLLFCGLLVFLFLSPARWGLGLRALGMLPTGAQALQDHIVTRLGYTLGGLLGAGVPILQSLSLSAELLPAYRYRPGLLKVREAIQNGNGLSEALQRARCFPKALIDIVEVGEASGRIPELLELLAQDASHALDARLHRLLTFLEPAVLLFLAVFVGGLALALFLPITQWVQQY